MINDLPPELVAQIFDLLTFGTSQFGSANHGEVIVTLATVCRYWHEVLLAHPQFWSKRRLRITSRLRNEPDPLVPRLVAHLKRWFEHAGDLPRKLSITFETTPRETKTLYNYLIHEHRWKTLEFVLDVGQATNWTWLEQLMRGAAKWKGRNDGHHCWPNLQSLTIRAEGATFIEGKRSLHLPLQSIAPNLRVFLLEVGRLDDPQYTVLASVPWESLRHFEFNGTLPDEAHLHWHFHVPDLTKARNLESLTIHYRYAYQTSYIIPAPFPNPVTHRNLVRLTLRAHFTSIYPFLSSVVLPSLRSLDLCSTVFSPFPRGRRAPTPFANSLSKLVSRSRSQIKALRLRNLPGHPDDLHNSLAELPTLESIELRPPPFTRDDLERDTSVFQIFQEDASRSHILCPNLRTFTYKTRKRSLVADRSNEDFALFRRDPLEWYKAEVARINRKDGPIPKS